MPHISVVAPIFNEEQCLPELYRRLTAVLSGMTDSYEIVLVDDGSRDSSWEIIDSLALQDAHVRGFRFSRNFGHHYCIIAGLDHCDGDWVVVMDSDLQDPPEAIIELYAKAMEGNDVVIVRRLDRQYSWFKNLASRVFHTTFSYLTDINYERGGGVFRMMSRRAVGAIGQLREASLYFPGVVDWVGFPRSHISFAHGERFAGTTKYPLRRQIRLAISTILSFSDKPLNLIVHFGLVTFLLASGYAGYIVVRSLLGAIALPGYPSIVVSILMMGGATISTLGLVGLYVGRIFQQVKARPLYIVGDRTDDKRQSS